MERTQAVQKRCEHGNTVDSLRCEPQCPHSSAALIAAMLRKKGLEPARTLDLGCLGGGRQRAHGSSPDRRRDATKAPARGQGASLSFLSKPAPAHATSRQPRRGARFWAGSRDQQKGIRQQ